MHHAYIGDSFAFHVHFNFSITANRPKPTSFSCFKFKPCYRARASPFSTSTSHSESELRSNLKKSKSSFDLMNSTIAFSFDDKDLDDAALWAVIDSAAAASLSSAITSPGPRTKPLTPIPFPLNSPQPQFENRSRNHSHNYNPNLHGEVVQNHRPHKIPRTTTTPRSSPQQLMVVKHAHRTPTTPPAYTASSTETRDLAITEYCSPNASTVSCEKAEARHSLAGQFPTVSLFKEYQDAAMAILEKSDYTMISGNTYIKKTGWRKISFYFNLSFEIKDKTIEFDENRNVQRAEFIVRAYMQGGRFSDGWGSCERREKKFSKPNHDIPSTAETRAKNRACQDLLGIGEYRPGARHAQG